MNKVVHFEIPFDNSERSKEFYKKVFGWKLIDIPEMNYIMAHTGPTSEKGMNQESGFINGGMYKRDENSAKSPVVVIDVTSVDEYAEKVKQAGGKIFREKVKVGDMGFYAQVKDTEGNIIGIWENVKPEEPKE